MRILIIGTWQKEKAEAVREKAEELGRAIASAGHDLVSGTGEGVAHLVAQAYKKAGGKAYIKYLPLKSIQESVGEPLGYPGDTTIETKEDYPIRNAIMVRECDAVIALKPGTGGLGTLGEIINAVNDYKKPVVVYDIEPFATGLRGIQDLVVKIAFCNDANEALKKIGAY